MNLFRLGVLLARIYAIRGHTFQQADFNEVAAGAHASGFTETTMMVTGAFGTVE
jgi:hypothetical protein